MRSGFATSASFCALTAFSSWSPRSTSATRPPSAPSTTSVFSMREAGRASWALTSAMVRAPGVATTGFRGLRRRPRLARRERLGELEVGRVIVAVGKDDRVLARIGQHVEFLGGAAADRAGVRVHGAEAQPEAREDRRVGLVHAPVALGERGLVGMEAVGVLHHELARAHHAEARADLVAELGLDLVEVDRQLPVALQLPPREVGHDFLVGRPQHHVAVVAVLEAQQLRPEQVPAARLDPQLAGLGDRHRDLERPGAVHFLADHALDAAQHAQAHRQPGIEAARDPADQAGAQHQPMAHDFGLGRHFLEVLDRIRGQAHQGPLIFGDEACRRSQSAVS